MDIRIWLSRAYKIDLQIASKEEQILMWRNLANKTTATYGYIGGSSGGGVSHRLEEYCCKIGDAETELEKEKAKLVDIKQEIKATIDSVSDTSQRLLLENRYLLFKGWSDIANVLNYSYDHTRGALHKKALRSIENILNTP